MTRIFSVRSLFAFALCAVALRAAPPAPPPESALQASIQLADWKDIFAQLSAPATRTAHFEERRFFPFRKAPTILTGEIRIVPGRGLSLHYQQPLDYIVIVDARGVLMRDDHGRERTSPIDPHAQAATSALFHVLQFNLPKLEREFTLHGLRDHQLWTLGFEPRDSALDNLVGSIVVSGTAGTVSEIRLVKSGHQRIEIDLHDQQSGIAFTPADLARYFR
ncbi:MAG TPA: outer membrane lipoprotein carrier protein LolA [Opitutus sp.]|nr:outer membrane lipoprotein carrier protein LolA [Opitutus sp.]